MKISKMSKNINDLIRKYALLNASKFGKAKVESILGSIISEDPDVKKNIDDVKKLAKQIVDEINKLSADKINSELSKYSFERKVREEHKELPTLKNPVLRFAPSPSGPLHLGHSYVLGLNHLIAKRNNGKLILRIEDTNPENIYDKAYDLILEDANWLTNNGVSEVFIQSDRLGYYYDAAEKLVELGKAYVCLCSSDEFREYSTKMQDCPDRKISVKENQERFAKMFSEYKAGQAVLRIKTSMQNPNPAMRDFPLMRINEHSHPRKGTEFRLWPLMNLAVAVDDHLMGITHILRGKDHMDNEKRQMFIFDYLSWKKPETYYVGRINFKDMELSATQTRLAIERGEYSGWSDIRLPFLQAFKKRGYKPEALLRYAEEMGINETDKLVSKEEYFKLLNSFNKDLIDAKTFRYFFIEEPVKIVVKGAPKQKLELNLHPDNKKGGRKFQTNEDFYIERADLDKIKKLKEGSLIRLMDCLNFIKKNVQGSKTSGKGIEGMEFIFDSKEYEIFKEKGELTAHWLPVDAKQTKEFVLLKEDGTKMKGKGEALLEKLNPGTTVQFERKAFVTKQRDEETGEEVFWWWHK